MFDEPMDNWLDVLEVQPKPEQREFDFFSDGAGEDVESIFSADFNSLFKGVQDQADAGPKRYEPGEFTFTMGPTGPVKNIQVEPEVGDRMEGNESFGLLMKALDDYDRLLDDPKSTDEQRKEARTKYLELKQSR